MTLSGWSLVLALAGAFVLGAMVATLVVSIFASRDVAEGRRFVDLAKARERELLELLRERRSRENTQ